jgi:hypothetical protein
MPVLCPVAHGIGEAVRVRTSSWGCHSMGAVTAVQATSYVSSVRGSMLVSALAQGPYDV